MSTVSSISLAQFLAAINNDDPHVLCDALRRFSQQLQQECKTNTLDVRHTVLHQYLCGSPRATELFSVFDLCVQDDLATRAELLEQLFSAVQMILRCNTSTHRHAKTLDSTIAVRRGMVQRLKYFYRVFALPTSVRNAAFAIMAALRCLSAMCTCEGEQSARELFEKFHFSAKTVGDLCTKRAKNKQLGERADIRYYYIQFIMAMLRLSDGHMLHELAVTHHHFTASPLAQLAGDGERTAAAYLQCLRERYLGQSVPRSVRRAMFSTKVVDALLRVSRAAVPEAVGAAVRQLLLGIFSVDGVLQEAEESDNTVAVRLGGALRPAAHAAEADVLLAIARVSPLAVLRLIAARDWQWQPRASDAWFARGMLLCRALDAFPAGGAGERFVREVGSVFSRSWLNECLVHESRQVRVIGATAVCLLRRAVQPELVRSTGGECCSLLYAVVPPCTVVAQTPALLTAMDVGDGDGDDDALTERRSGELMVIDCALRSLQLATAARCDDLAEQAGAAGQFALRTAAAGVAQASASGDAGERDFVAQVLDLCVAICSADAVRGTALVAGLGTLVAAAVAASDRAGGERALVKALATADRSELEATVWAEVVVAHPQFVPVLQQCVEEHALLPALLGGGERSVERDLFAAHILYRLHALVHGDAREALDGLLRELLASDSGGGRRGRKRALSVCAPLLCCARALVAGEAGTCCEPLCAEHAVLAALSSGTDPLEALAAFELGDRQVVRCFVHLVRRGALEAATALTERRAVVGRCVELLVRDAADWSSDQSPAMVALVASLVDGALRCGERQWHAELQRYVRAHVKGRAAAQALDAGLRLVRSWLRFDVAGDVAYCVRYLLDALRLRETDAATREHTVAAVVDALVERTRCAPRLESARDVVDLLSLVSAESGERMASALLGGADGSGARHYRYLLRQQGTDRAIDDAAVANIVTRSGSGVLAAFAASVDEATCARVVRALVAHLGDDGNLAAELRERSKQIVARWSSETAAPQRRRASGLGVRMDLAPIVLVLGEAPSLDESARQLLTLALPCVIARRHVHAAAVCFRILCAHSSLRAAVAQPPPDDEVEVTELAAVCSLVGGSVAVLAALVRAFGRLIQSQQYEVALVVELLHALALALRQRSQALDAAALAEVRLLALYKAVLKRHYGETAVQRALDAVVGACEALRAAAELLLFAHSRTVPLLLSGCAQCGGAVQRCELRAAVARALATLFVGGGTAGWADVPRVEDVLLSAYGGTCSEADVALFEAVRRLEQRRPLRSARWGVARASASGDGAHDFGEVLKCVDRERMWYTAFHFPMAAAASGGEQYDPAFVLPLLISVFVHCGVQVDLRFAVCSGCVPLAVSACRSPRQRVRELAWHALQRYDTLLEMEERRGDERKGTFRQAVQARLVLRYARASCSSAADGMVLASPIASFLVSALHELFYKEQSEFAKDIFAAMLSRYYLPPRDLPLFHESLQRTPRSATLVLQMMCAALQADTFGVEALREAEVGDVGEATSSLSSDALGTLRRHRALERVLTLCGNARLYGARQRWLGWRFLELYVATRAGALDAVLRCGLCAWLTAVLCTERHERAALDTRFAADDALVAPLLSVAAAADDASPLARIRRIAYEHGQVCAFAALVLGQVAAAVGADDNVLSSTRVALHCVVREMDDDTREREMLAAECYALLTRQASV